MISTRPAQLERFSHASFVVLLILSPTLVSAAPKRVPKQVVPDPATQAAANKLEASRLAKLRGDAALDAGRPVEALAAYEEAFALAPSSVLLFNRARCHERLEQFPQALELLERFSLEAEDAVRARVPALDELVASYRARVARLFIVVPVEGVEVRLGERILGRSPLPQPLAVNAGKPTTLSISDERYFPVSRPVELVGGRDVHVDVRLDSRETKAVLRVSSGEAGATASVDDAESGNVPLDVVVAPGTHQVRLVKEGYVPALTSVLVKAGELRLVDIGIQREPRLYERWYFWAAVGVVVAAGASVAVAWTIERPALRGTLNSSEPPLAPSLLPWLVF